MKHAVVGIVVGGVIVTVFTVWALLGALVGPEWALVVMAFAAATGVLAAVFDYKTEVGSE